MKGKRPFEAAQIEALEEAGAKGQISKKSIGSFDYFKRQEAHFELCTVKVFPLRFLEQSPTWREHGQRFSRWIEPELAAELVEEPGLKAILMDFLRRIERPKFRKHRQTKAPEARGLHPAPEG